MLTHPILLLMLLSADIPEPTGSFPPSLLSTAIADCHPLSANSSALVWCLCGGSKGSSPADDSEFSMLGLSFCIESVKSFTQNSIKSMQGLQHQALQSQEWIQKSHFCRNNLNFSINVHDEGDAY